jgi:hypothetical protein
METFESWAEAVIDELARRVPGEDREQIREKIMPALERERSMVFFHLGSGGTIDPRVFVDELLAGLKEPSEKMPTWGDNPDWEGMAADWEELAAITEVEEVFDLTDEDLK